MEESYEAYLAAEEVASDELTGTELTTVVEQLDQVQTLQVTQLFGTCVLVGAVIGCAVAKVIGGTWR